MRSKYGDRYDVFSGGIDATSVHPMAIEVMKEIGIDISGLRSKSVEEFFGKDIRIVVTVCDEAARVCPFFPGAEEPINQNFPNPLEFTGSEDQIRSGFRQVRDQITHWIDMTFGKDEARVNPVP